VVLCQPNGILTRQCEMRDRMNVHPHRPLLAGRSSLGAPCGLTIGCICSLTQAPIALPASLVYALAGGRRDAGGSLAPDSRNRAAPRNNCGRAVSRDGNPPLFLGILRFSYALCDV
jgi:hypothetical protein